MLLDFVHNLILFSLLCFFSIYLFIFSYKYRKVNKYGFNSTILTVFILMVLAFCILFVDGLIPYPLNAAINIWLFIVFGVQIAYFTLIKVKFKESGNKTNIDDTTYDGGELKLTSEYLRKSFHISILLVVFCFFFFALWINKMIYDVYLADPQLYYTIWHISEYPLPPNSSANLTIAFTWTFMLFICATMFLLIPDIFRIYNRKYSLFSGIYKKVIRLKELYACGPQIYLTLSCTFVFLFAVLGIISVPVVIAGILIAAFGDAAAAIIGRKFGKHQFNTFFERNGKKSYEGLIAGFSVSYITAFIFVGPIVAFFGAIVFSIIDYLNFRIADNVLNPILCTLAMIIPYGLFV